VPLQATVVLLTTKGPATSSSPEARKFLWCLRKPNKRKWKVRGFFSGFISYQAPPDVCDGPEHRALLSFCNQFVLGRRSVYKATNSYFMLLLNGPETMTCFGQNHDEHKGRTWSIRGRK
jgi:hypothetical protein